MLQTKGRARVRPLGGGANSSERGIWPTSQSKFDRLTENLRRHRSDWRRLPPDAPWLRPCCKPSLMKIVEFFQRNKSGFRSFSSVSYRLRQLSLQAVSVTNRETRKLNLCGNLAVLSSWLMVVRRKSLLTIIATPFSPLSSITHFEQKVVPSIVRLLSRI